VTAHLLALAFALAALVCMLAAIAGMVTGRPGARAGWALRALSLACFAAAVALGALTH